jgi:hypothetical protein
MTLLEVLRDSRNSSCPALSRKSGSPDLRRSIRRNSGKPELRCIHVFAAFLACRLTPIFLARNSH